MKIRLALSMLLVATPGLTAQTSQVDEGASSKTEVPNVSRARRSTDASLSAIPKQTPERKVAATNSVEAEKKPSETLVNAAESDIFTELKNRIETATTDSERITLRLQLAEELAKAGRKPEAIHELRSVSGMDVFDPPGFYNAGNALARLGESANAIEAYRKAIGQRKGNYSRAYNNLGVVLLRMGRWDEAHGALLSAMKLESFRYAEASYNLGRLYAMQGQSDLAAREWRRTLSINPKHTAAADSLRRLDSEEQVTVASAPKTVAVANVGNRPASTANRTLMLDQASFNFLQRARSENEKGNSAEAVANYKRVISRQAGYFAPANLELSFTLLSLKRYDEALSNLQLVVSKDGSRFPISYYHLGRMYEIKSELKQAEASYTQAAKSFGEGNPQFLLDVSRVREKQGDFKGALDSMELYLSLMRQKGEQPSWSNDRLTALRQKATAPKD